MSETTVRVSRRPSTCDPLTRLLSLARRLVGAIADAPDPGDLGGDRDVRHAARMLAGELLAATGEPTADLEAWAELADDLLRPDRRPLTAGQRRARAELTPAEPGDLAHGPGLAMRWRDRALEAMPSPDLDVPVGVDVELRAERYADWVEAAEDVAEAARARLRRLRYDLSTVVRNGEQIDADVRVRMRRPSCEQSIEPDWRAIALGLASATRDGDALQAWEQEQRDAVNAPVVTLEHRSAAADAG